MEVFSWRFGPVGFGRTEDRPLQRSKTSSGDMSQSGPDYPGQGLCRPTSTQVIQGSNCLSIGPKDNNKRMTIEHAECSIQGTLRALAISTRQHPALLSSMFKSYSAVWVQMASTRPNWVRCALRAR